ncbi:MAG TPA: glycoside hydrolase family 88 protein [Polyangiaceae bacterium]
MLSIPLSSCSQEGPSDDDAPAGTSGTGAGQTGAGTGGASAGTGGSPQAGTGGQVMQSGGSAGTATAGTAGALAGSGGSTGGAAGSAGTGTVSGASGGGAGGTTGGTGPGGTGGSGGSAGGQACAAQCVAQCVPWGGTEQPGTCEGTAVCCEGAIEPPPNPLAHLVESARSVGTKLSARFRAQSLAFSSVANLPGDGYKTACEWYGSLGVAKLTSDQALLDGLVTKFDPLKANFVSAMTSGEKHVDRYIFGIVPLEIYLQTGEVEYRDMGVAVADDQQISNQTRDAIDDMFMMTSLQVQAYRAVKVTDAEGAKKYLDFMSAIMVDYLGAQQTNGLFFHNVTQARVHWGRGNGWFAAGMAEMMRDLPTGAMHYATILDGYKKMMEGLLPFQSDNGLWYQVLNLPDDGANWEESSGTAMFTYAMIAGVRRGVLDAATYVPVIEKAWTGLQSKINGQGDVSDICVGTWYKASAAEYMALTRLTGDGHGQAPVIWAAAELLR